MSYHHPKNKPDEEPRTNQFQELHEYVRALAESARGAELMRPRVIEQVTTIALIDRACGFKPARLVYSNGRRS